MITLQLPHPTLQHLANRQDTDVLPPDIANIHYAKEIQMSYIQNTEGLQRQSSLQGGSKFKEIQNVLQTYNIQGYRGNTKGGSREKNTGLHSKSKGAHDTDALLPDIADICTLCNKQKENNQTLQCLMKCLFSAIKMDCMKLIEISALKYFTSLV